MKGIVIAAHGSKRLETEQTLDWVCEYVQERTGETHIALGFMEFSERTIDKALNQLVQEGCDDILIVPYFLFTGMHLRHDIPKLMDAWKKNHPEISVSLGRTLGKDVRLAEIVYDQSKAFLDA